MRNLACISSAFYSALWVSLAAHPVEPQPGGIYGELRGVVVNAEADITKVGADVVNAIGNHLAEVFSKSWASTSIG
jgi:hypothetical protein